MFQYNSNPFTTQQTQSTKNSTQNQYASFTHRQTIRKFRPVLWKSLFGGFVKEESPVSKGKFEYTLVRLEWNRERYASLWELEVGLCSQKDLSELVGGESRLAQLQDLLDKIVHNNWENHYQNINSHIQRIEKEMAIEAEAEKLKEKQDRKQDLLTTNFNDDDVSNNRNVNTNGEKEKSFEERSMNNTDINSSYRTNNINTMRNTTSAFMDSLIQVGSTINIKDPTQSVKDITKSISNLSTSFVNGLNLDFQNSPPPSPVRKENFNVNYETNQFKNMNKNQNNTMNGGYGENGIKYHSNDHGNSGHRNQDLDATDYINSQKHLSFQMMMLRILATWYYENYCFYIRSTTSKTGTQIGDESDDSSALFHNFVFQTMETRLQLLSIILYALLDGEAAWNNTFSYPPSYHTDNVSFSSTTQQPKDNHNIINTRFTSNSNFIEDFNDPTSMPPETLLQTMDSIYLEHDAYFLFCRLMYIVEPICNNSSTKLDDCSTNVLEMIGSVDPILLSELKSTTKNINEQQRKYETLQKQNNNIKTGYQENITPTHIVGPLVKTLGSAFLPPSVVVRLWDQGFVSLLTYKFNDHENFFQPMEDMQRSVFNANQGPGNSINKFPPLDSSVFLKTDRDKVLLSAEIDWLDKPSKTNPNRAPVFLYIYLSILLHIKDLIFSYHDSLLDTLANEIKGNINFSQGNNEPNNQPSRRNSILKNPKIYSMELYTMLQQTISLQLARLSLGLKIPTTNSVFDNIDVPKNVAAIHFGDQMRGQENNDTNILFDVTSSSFVPIDKFTHLDTILIDAIQRMINPETVEQLFPSSIQVIKFDEPKLGMKLHFNTTTEEYIVSSVSGGDIMKRINLQDALIGVNGVKLNFHRYQMFEEEKGLALRAIKQIANMMKDLPRPIYITFRKNVNYITTTGQLSLPDLYNPPLLVGEIIRRVIKCECWLPFILVGYPNVSFKLETGFLILTNYRLIFHRLQTPGQTKKYDPEYMKQMQYNSQWTDFVGEFEKKETNQNNGTESNHEQEESKVKSEESQVETNKLRLEKDGQSETVVNQSTSRKEMVTTTKKGEGVQESPKEVGKEMEIQIDDDVDPLSFFASTSPSSGPEGKADSSLASKRVAFTPSPPSSPTNTTPKISAIEHVPFASYRSEPSKYQSIQTQAPYPMSPSQHNVGIKNLANYSTPSMQHERNSWRGGMDASAIYFTSPRKQFQQPNNVTKQEPFEENAGGISSTTVNSGKEGKPNSTINVGGGNKSKKLDEDNLCDTNWQIPVHLILRIDATYGYSQYPNRKPDHGGNSGHDFPINHSPHGNTNHGGNKSSFSSFKSTLSNMQSQVRQSGQTSYNNYSNNQHFYGHGDQQQQVIMVQPSNSNISSFVGSSGLPGYSMNDVDRNSYLLLTITCKDGQVKRFVFTKGEEDKVAIFTSILAKSIQIEDEVFAFSHAKSVLERHQYLKHKAKDDISSSLYLWKASSYLNWNPLSRGRFHYNLFEEYLRLGFGDMPQLRPIFQHGYSYSETLLSKNNRISSFDREKLESLNRANNRTICDTYPPILWVPDHIDDRELIKVCAYRSINRFPTVVWCNKFSKVTMARSAQPLVGIQNNRCFEDETLLKYLATMTKRQRYVIIDARAKISSQGNKLMGKGSEQTKYYHNTDILYMNISNIHSVRDSETSMFSLHRPMIPPAAANSKIAKYHPWGIEKMLPNTAYFSGNNNGSFNKELDSCGWMDHVQKILNASILCVDYLIYQETSILVHCSDGWDRTAQICALSQLLIDPYHRTVQGFQVLIEKEWIDFGHQFATRSGYLNVNSNDDQRSPIFVLFLDCVWQVLRQYPDHFEFNEALLLALCDHVYSCRFGTFLKNSYKERKEMGIDKKTISFWRYVDDNLEELFLNHGYEPILTFTPSDDRPTNFKKITSFNYSDPDSVIQNQFQQVLIPSTNMRNLKVFSPYFSRRDYSSLPTNLGKLYY